MKISFLLYWVVFQSILNFILVSLYKYGILKRNIRGYVKKKFNIDFGDHVRVKNYEGDKQV